MSQTPDGFYPPPQYPSNPGGSYPPPEYPGPSAPSYGPPSPYAGGPPPLQPPERGGKGKVIGTVIAVVVGLFVVGVGALMAIGLAVGDPEAGDASASTSSPDAGAASPSTSSGFADGQKIAAVRLRKGDCVQSKGKGDVSDLDVVSCSQSHDGEVIGVYKASGASYPGEDAITAEAERRCGKLVPKNLEASDRDDLSNYFIYPKSANWAVGDREVECLVVAEDPLTTPLSEL